MHINSNFQNLFSSMYMKFCHLHALKIQRGYCILPLEHPLCLGPTIKILCIQIQIIHIVLYYLKEMVAQQALVYFQNLMLIGHSQNNFGYQYTNIMDNSKMLLCSSVLFDLLSVWLVSFKHGSLYGMLVLQLCLYSSLQWRTICQKEKNCISFVMYVIWRIL